MAQSTPRAARRPVTRGASPTDLAWRVLRDGPLPGDLNMARDHALALARAPGEAVLRLYGWATPTLSLGRNEPAVGLFSPTSLRGAGVDVVRRPTGGRSVLHHRELTYSVVLPLRGLGGLREAYRRINRALAGGLARVGVEAEIAGSTPGARSPGPDAGPCFDLPAPGEVVAGGRKLVGSAQARMGDSLLQHGSILIEDDQGLVRELGVGDAGPGEDPRAGPGRPATLRALLGDAVPTRDELVEALVAGFREELPGRWHDAPPPLDGEEERRLRAKYASEGWTWRR